jgi:outer membrane lipoprotein-sorting protein
MKLGLQRVVISVLIVAAALLEGGCLSTRRVVPATERLLPARSASREELLEKLQDLSKSIETLTGTITLDASGGALKTGVLTEYRQTKGFVIVERPNNIRIKAQAPLALATVFDMVSDGQTFHVSIPVKNQFFEGDAHAPAKASNPILNLRPQHIMAALFVDISPYANRSGVRSIMEETTSGQISYYVFSFIDVDSTNAELLEKIWIDRTNMEIVRKQIFGRDGRIDTDVTFSGHHSVEGVSFPEVILIQRPQEDYMLKLTFQKADINDDLAAEAFHLERPAGSELVRLEPDGTNGP